MRPGLLRWVKLTVFVLALLPFLRLLVGAFTNQLGANPIEFITRSTGSWTLYLLCMTLAVTPLRHLTAWSSLLRFRRMLGLFTFFYATLHFITFLWFDHFFDFGAMWRDVLKRPFITVGFIAFVLMIPLAVTSNDRMVRRLGRRWARLHRSVYVIAALAILHFWWMRAGKNDFGEPILFGSLVGVLLLTRVYLRLRSSGSPRGGG